MLFCFSWVYVLATSGAWCPAGSFSDAVIQSFTELVDKGQCSHLHWVPLAREGAAWEDLHVFLLIPSSSLNLDFFSSQQYSGCTNRYHLCNYTFSFWAPQTNFSVSKNCRSTLLSMIQEQKSFIFKGVKLCKALLKVKGGCQTVQELCKNIPCNIMLSVWAFR